MLHLHPVLQLFLAFHSLPVRLRFPVLQLLQAVLVLHLHPVRLRFPVLQLLQAVLGLHLHPALRFLLCWLSDIYMECTVLSFHCKV